MGVASNNVRHKKPADEKDLGLAELVRHFQTPACVSATDAAIVRSSVWRTVKLTTDVLN